MCGVPVSSRDAKRKEMDYQAEEDLRTLSRAEEIRADGKRMANCRRAHRKQSRSMARTGRTLNRRA